MKKLIILFCLNLCLFSIIDAQEKSASFRLELSSNSIFPEYDRVRNFNNGLGSQISKRVYNYAIQLSGFYRLTPRLDLGLGLGYANLDAFSNLNCIYCDSPGFVSYTKFRAIEMPMELRIAWFKKPRKVAPYFSVGATSRIYQLYGHTIEGEEIKIAEDEFSVGANAGMGIHFNLTEKWSLNVAGHYMISTYYSIDGLGKLPSSEQLDWLNEWYVKVGISRFF